MTSNPLLLTALMSYALSGSEDKSDIFPMHHGDTFRPTSPRKGSLGNKYSPSECPNSKAKARRLRQMAKNNGGTNVHPKC